MVTLTCNILTLVSVLTSAMGLEAANNFNMGDLRRAPHQHNQPKPPRTVTGDAMGCKIEYGDSSIDLRKTCNQDYYLRWEADQPRSMSATFWVFPDETYHFSFVDGARSTKCAGSDNKMETLYARVCPLPPLMDSIEHAFTGGMNQEKCLMLAEKIEDSPLEGYVKGNWLKQFFLERMSEAFEVDNRQWVNGIPDRIETEEIICKLAWIGSRSPAERQIQAFPRSQS
ncbi:hypothetical protein FOZ61_000541 [Perkinsus olseni]|uniref:Uncharacterized protein n=1 Tax=Perkinsus olseni TaxID=32597 RepID=A0A7J6MH89_PEROL|nr:hypothetical protein FOZ61_000541 [Perkinsus olseni]KAF4675843.1 hypothetical protein FOL46_009634 [Perkinsus olseni]